MKLNKLIVKKILWYKEHYSCAAATARALKISRYSVSYWYGNLKKKPKKFYEPENIDAERSIILLEKALINDQILKGKFNQDQPIEEAQRLRQEFKVNYDMYPEEIC